MASSVTEGQIQKLRNTGYLSSDIAHRLPIEGELVPIPKPATGQLLVKVAAAALNPSDWKSHVMGYYKGPYPMVGGFDGAGVVEDVGEDVTGFTKGDRV